MAVKQPLAARLAESVMRDLRGRKGILDGVEPDIQDDMQHGLANVIAEELAVELGGKTDGVAVIV